MRDPMHLQIHADQARSHVAHLRHYLRKANRILPISLHELSIALVNDATMSRLHVQHMNIPGPTDVLTFPLDAHSGEIVICVPEARRRCKTSGIPLQNELLLYAIHGMLHLCGFDDRTESGFKKMHRKEDEILTKLGVGPVFHTRGLKPTRRVKKKSKRAR
jgi:probable rRNA maturation factor